MSTADRHMIVANYQHGTKIAADGAKVYVLWMTGNGESVEVVTRSRGGRWVRKYEQIKHLGNFRIKTVVEDGCPAKAWQHARETRDELADDLKRCLDCRATVRTIDRDLGDEDALS